MLNAKLIAAGVGIAIIAGAWFHGNYHGRNVMKLKIEQANKAALEAVMHQQEQINVITQNLTDERNSIMRQRDTLLIRLRDRPNRVSQTTETKCQGASGADLSRQDAEFLTREASRSDRLRIALKACYDYADSIQKN